MRTILNRKKEKINSETLKSEFLTGNKSLEDLADDYELDVDYLTGIAEDDGWISEKVVLIQKGIDQIQGMQIDFGKSLLDADNVFNKLKMVQIQSQKDAYLAYFAKYGHLYKVNPVDGSVLTDHDKIPIPIRIPNLSKDITSLKESVTVAEGMRKLMSNVDQLALGGNKAKALEGGKKLDKKQIKEFDYLFDKSLENPEEE